MATTKTLVNQISTKKLTNAVLAYSSTSGGTTFLYPVIQASIVLVSGVGTFQGNTSISGASTDALNMTVGQAINLTANNNCPVGSFTVDTSGGGVANIIFTFLVEN